jgi:hypothetical protein
MPDIKLAKTARDKILEPYEEGKIPYEFRTTPISAVAQMRGEVVATNDGIGWCLFRPQAVKFFRKGDGDTTVFGSVNNSDVTDAESNLQRAGSTDGARDMAIEGLQISPNGIVTQFAEADLDNFGTDPTDANVLAALRGQSMLLDPFGVVLPAQLQSPFLLESAIFQSLMQLSTVRIELDTSRPYKLGLASLYPGMSGQSMLRSNGLPATNNLFGFPEGILWKRDGKSDSDLKLIVELHRPVLVALSQVTFPGGSATLPANVYQRIAVDIIGVSVTELGDN